jgi:sec-independent protein translocase protein TatA
MFRNPLIDAIVVLLVVLLIFGPKRLPQLGKSLGHGMREFKDGITGNSKADDEEEPRPELTQASAAVPAPETPASQPSAETAPAPEVGSAERRS